MVMGCLKRQPQTVDKAPSCEGALSTVCLFIVIFTVIFFFPNHASYFL